MIKFEKTETWGFEHAIRGMRNPMNSWEKSDSDFGGDGVVIGDNDLNLMKRLIKAGTTHRKFLRQIFVSVDITAPLYWYKEFETYKVGTTSNSCSTMHKIHAKEFTKDDFSFEYLGKFGEGIIEDILEALNEARYVYNNFDALTAKNELAEGATKKNTWYSMIQLLPSSYNQKRTVTMSYENILNMLETRRGHKLDEWRQFCEWAMKLPYAAEIFSDYISL